MILKFLNKPSEKSDCLTTIYHSIPFFFFNCCVGDVCVFLPSTDKIIVLRNHQPKLRIVTVFILTLFPQLLNCFFFYAFYQFLCLVVPKHLLYTTMLTPCIACSVYLHLFGFVSSCFLFPVYYTYYDVAKFLKLPDMFKSKLCRFILFWISFLLFIGIYIFFAFNKTLQHIIEVPCRRLISSEHLDMGFFIIKSFKISLRSHANFDLFFERFIEFLLQ